MTANLPQQLEKYLALYKACRYDSDFSPCDEIRFFQSAENILADLEASIALNRELVRALYRLLKFPYDREGKNIAAQKQSREAITLAAQHGITHE